MRRRAEYGAETEVNTHIRPAQYFKTAQVDALLLGQKKGRLLELQADIKEIYDDIATKNGNIDELESMVQSLEDTKASLMSVLDRGSRLTLEKKKIKEEKEAKQNAASFGSEIEQEKLSTFESAGKGFKQKVAELEASMVQLSMERVDSAAQYAEHVQEYVARYEAIVTAELHLIEASSNIEHYNSWNKSYQERIEGKERQCEEAKEKYNSIVAQASRSRDECRELMNILLADQQEAIQNTHSKKTVEELNAEIRQEEVRLESIHEGNPHAIKQYEARENEINELRNRMDNKQATLDKHRDVIKEVRGRWEPRIDQLVSNISDAFSRSFEFIHCAGAVQIRKEGKDGCDFENWAIEIMVKFREAESMQVLTAQRQSGGERAVSTVFYLMALQSLARAPFRVVDEINQGMDPRNERLVHKRMVKIACKKHTSQYFLITPKLLVDLDYHERMKVLCINSGDWVAGNHVQDFSRYIAAGRRLLAAA
ncbi:hypothetical protein ABW20_dc0107098 [Dactylellina cionopaga]|nr:hypothetical protein ABW20_dc0107098 [Dactylellina cionopaga]